MSIESLKPFLAPRSIAILGASENPNKIGGRPLAYLRRFGFKGPVWAINPTRAEVQGYTCVPSLDDLPEVPDVVVVAVPGDHAVAAVEACAKKGVKGLICMSSGFGETSDPVGKAKEARMVAAARAAGMRMVGPNTQGLANFGNGAVTSFSTMWMECEPVDGPIAMVSQSGAMSAVPIGLLFEQGLGVRYSLATGNDADVNVLEMATAAASDPEIKLLLLYLESIPRPELLEALAATAHARGVYVVALKSGRTEAGQRAALSHTGALANEDRVVDAALERVGIWRARNIGELVSAAADLSQRLEAARASPRHDFGFRRHRRHERRRSDVREPRDGSPRRTGAPETRRDPSDVRVGWQPDRSHRRIALEQPPALRHPPRSRPRERRRQFHDRLPDRGARLRHTDLRP